MGGTQSTRRVTIVNNTNPDVISISDDVVERLNSHPSSPRTQQAATIMSGVPVSAGYPSYSEISGRSHQAEMDKLDQEWRTRLEDLNRQNQQLYKLATDKFTGEVTNVHREYVNDCTRPVCQNTQNAVLECYQKNSKQPLRCSREVAAFQNCVSATRLYLSAK
ncbi:coiled-coil-helix-coiled-coil-helix domain-containing protein 6 [Tropilaelaps mercedesae]|uniref:Coiled-coil-helix-coiled-coil-helix domain-containing protein 6 n=1 Tax=Tropilaelaps mercedesae TaxID=418985 RepID=A0A1V9X761_9ACAR|nr:coiled-coil-helix-coiled-coil-helix domain-containing protein 6 [Tropilaelaps mercedesae]